MGRLKWVSIGLMAVGLFSLIWSGTRSTLSSKAKSQILAQLDAASDTEAVPLLEQIASWGDSGVPLLVETLNSPRLALSQAARRILLDRFDAWRWPATPESSARLQRLAEALADQIPHFSAPGRAAANDLAARILCWPVDQRYLDRHRLLSCCECVVAAAGKEKPALANESVAGEAAHLLFEDPSAGSGTNLAVAKGSTSTTSTEKRPPPNPVRDKIAEAPVRPATAPTELHLATALPSIAQMPTESENTLGTTEAQRFASRVALASAVESPRDRHEAVRRQFAAVDTWELFRRFGTADPATQADIHTELTARGITERDLALACQLLDPDVEVRKKLVAGLPGMPGVEPVRWLWQAAHDPHPDVRLQALSLLATTADRQLIEQVEGVAREDGDPRIQRLAQQIGQWRTAPR